MGLIYALVDPTSKKVKYIGKTIRKNAAKRLSEHICYSSKRSNKHGNWLKGLLDSNLLPELKVLINNISGPTLCHAEIEMIAHYKQFNELTNASDGGDGAIRGHGKGNPHTKKQKKIYQFSLDGSLIKEWNSLKEAAIAVNVDISNISRAAQRGGTSMGFLWNYEKIHYNRSKMVDIINNLIKFN